MLQQFNEQFQNQFATYDDLLQFVTKVQYHLMQQNNIPIESYLESKEQKNKEFSNIPQNIIYQITGQIDTRNDEEIVNDEQLTQNLLTIINQAIKDKNYQYNKRYQQETLKIIKQICGDIEQSGIIQANQIIYSIKAKLNDPQLTQSSNLIDFILLNKDRIVSEIFYFNDMNTLIFGIKEQKNTAEEIIQLFNKNMAEFEEKYNISFKVALQRALQNDSVNFIQDETQIPIFKDIQYSDFILTKDYKLLKETIQSNFQIKVTSIVNWLSFLQNLVKYTQLKCGNNQCLALNVFQLNNSEFHSATSKIYYQLTGEKVKFTTVNQLIAELTNKINLFSRKTLCVYDCQVTLKKGFFCDNKVQVNHNHYIMIRREEDQLIDQAINMGLLAVYNIFKIEDQLTVSIPYQSLNVLMYVVDNIDGRLKELGYKEHSILERLGNYEQKLVGQLYLCLCDKLAQINTYSISQLQRKIIRQIQNFNNQFSSINVEPIGYSFNKFLVKYPNVYKEYQQNLSLVYKQTKFTKFLNQQFNQENLTVKQLIYTIKQLDITSNLIQQLLIYNNDRQLEFLTEFGYMLISTTVLYKKTADFANFAKTYQNKLLFNCNKVINQYFYHFPQIQEKKMELVLSNETCQVVKKILVLLGYDSLRTEKDILTTIQQLYAANDFLKQQFKLQKQSMEGLIPMLENAQRILQGCSFILPQKTITSELLDKMLMDTEYEKRIGFDEFRISLDSFTQDCQSDLTTQELFLLIDRKHYVNQSLLGLQKFTKEQQKQLYQQISQLFIDQRLKKGRIFLSIYDLWLSVKQEFTSQEELNKKLEDLKSQSVAQTEDQSVISQMSNVSTITQPLQDQQPMNAQQYDQLIEQVNQDQQNDQQQEQQQDLQQEQNNQEQEQDQNQDQEQQQEIQQDQQEQQVYQQEQEQQQQDQQDNQKQEQQEQQDQYEQNQENQEQQYEQQYEENQQQQIQDDNQQQYEIIQQQNQYEDQQQYEHQYLDQSQQQPQDQNLQPQYQDQQEEQQLQQQSLEQPQQDFQDQQIYSQPQQQDQQEQNQEQIQQQLQEQNQQQEQTNQNEIQ